MATYKCYISKQHTSQFPNMAYSRCQITISFRFFICRFKSHFERIFVWSTRYELWFTALHMDIQLAQYHLLKTMLFRVCVCVCPSMWKFLGQDQTCSRAVTQATALTKWILNPLYHKRTPYNIFYFWKFIQVIPTYIQFIKNTWTFWFITIYLNLGNQGLNYLIFHVWCAVLWVLYQVLLPNISSQFFTFSLMSIRLDMSLSQDF